MSVHVLLIKGLGDSEDDWEVNSVHSTHEKAEAAWEKHLRDAAAAGELWGTDHRVEEHEVQ